MKRSILSLALVVIALAGTGCLAVSATDNSHGLKATHQVVAVANKVYLIDTRTGEASEIDLSKAKPLKSCETMPDTTAGSQ